MNDKPEAEVTKPSIKPRKKRTVPKETKSDKAEREKRERLKARNQRKRASRRTRLLAKPFEHRWRRYLANRPKSDHSPRRKYA